MSMFDSLRLTEGHLARHTPAGSGAPGREAAIIDIGQDLLLAYLEKEKLMDKVALKGGTAIRKLYAGKEGRFSLDLDFAVDDAEAKTEDRAFDFISEIDGLKLGPFTYSISERRNKWYIGLSSSFNDGEIFRTKLDFASYPWLPTVRRKIVTLPIHVQYGFELPEINTVRLEENIAEKIARLNRSNTARDLYDLNWIMENPSVSTMVDKQLLRRLAVLKIWVDSHGMHYGSVWWKPAHTPSVFDPDRWLDDRDPDAIDAEDIGTLAVPAPTGAELVERLKANFSFLKDLDEMEAIIARSNAKDRSLVIQTLTELPGGKLKKGLY